MRWRHVNRAREWLSPFQIPLLLRRDLVYNSLRPMRFRYVKWTLGAFAVLAAAYILLFSTVVLAMLQPPERFGLFMRHAPEAVVWGALPASRMWLWARSGRVNEGDRAPDFTLSTLDHKQRVTLSSYAGQRPVVLVFGSYT